MADYLLNGVRFPEFPESITDNYSHFMIGIPGQSNYWLFAFSKPVTAKTYTQTDGSVVTRVTGEVPAAYSIFSSSTNQWSDPHEVTTAGRFDYVDVADGAYFWANHDVQKDGEVWYTASDPVPVSPVKLNPALLVQSFFTGQAIRRMRGKAAPDITDAELVDGVLYIRNAVATLNQNVLEVV